MMTNLFSTFDPSTIMNTSLNWLSMMITILLLPMSFWFVPSRIMYTWTTLKKNLHKEFKTITNKKTTLMFISVFSTIMMMNISSMFPYIFPSTSQIVLTLAMALPLWLSFMIFGWTQNTNHMLAHLVPQGTPNILMPFMVCIETISNMIRPVTLAIRLSANIIAGHLLLTLIGTTGIHSSMKIIPLIIIAQLMLMTLEFAVAIIQSYVFSILSTLYSSET